MLVTEKLKNFKTPLLVERGNVYWLMIDRFNLSILAICLSKVMEVYERYGEFVPERYRPNLKVIFQDISKRKIRQFRNKYCGHILDKTTGAPISENEIASMFYKIRGVAPYSDFEDWFWATGRPNSENSIAATLEKIRDAIVWSERITQHEMSLVL